MSVPFALVVRFSIRPGAEKRFDDLVERTVQRIRTEEPGTLVYFSHRVDNDPQLRIFYELYTDRQAFEAHERQEYVMEFLAAREALLSGVEVEVMSAVTGKAPFGGSV